MGVHAMRAAPISVTKTALKMLMNFLQAPAIEKNKLYGKGKWQPFKSDISEEGRNPIRRFPSKRAPYLRRTPISLSLWKGY